MQENDLLYAKQRPGGHLHKAHAACRAVGDAGLPLEITFAPTRINIHEVQSVIERALTLGAYRFNTGKLMRIGRAARLWHKLAPSAEQYRIFRSVLDASARQVGDAMRLCYAPFSIEESLWDFMEQAPATMLVLPNGKVKVAAVLPYLCADLRLQSMTDAWDAYRSAWRDETVMDGLRRASDDDSRHEQANIWQSLPVLMA